MNRQDFLKRSALFSAGLVLAPGLAARKALAASPVAPVSFWPVGHIIAVGDMIPLGWLRCNGQYISKEEWPELFHLIGETYGKQGTQGRYRRLPDLRGKVARIQSWKLSTPHSHTYTPQHYVIYGGKPAGRAARQIESTLSGRAA